MTAKRRRFTPGYRHEAAELVRDTGQAIVAVAKQLEIGEQALGN